MKFQSLFKFYFFGTSLRYLQDVREGIKAHTQGWVIANIDSFLETLTELQLGVTERVAKSKLQPILDELNATSPNHVLTSKQATDLRSAVTAIRETLDAELAGVGAYTLTPKRIDLKRLVGEVDALFAPETFSMLPEIARFDFSEAGKCIAFERPTAAAFHMLRGTEATLRMYYQKMVRSNRISSQNWGPIVTDLRTRLRTKKFVALNNQLDNIRDSYRNPTQHPEAKYDIHEVQDLWSLCVDVVNRMIKNLRAEGLI
jgi:hypothetical protein